MTRKRDYGWGGSWAEGIEGATTWCGYGVFAHNAIKISGLIEARVSPATLDDHEGDTVGEHEFVNMLSPWWSLLAS